MRTWLALCLLWSPAAARGQDVATRDAPGEPTDVVSASPDAASPATPEEASSPMEEVAADDVPPAPSAGSRLSSSLGTAGAPSEPSGQGEPAVDPTSGRLLEVYWAASGLVLSGFSPSLTTRVDLALMIDDQWAFGVKVDFSYSETRADSFGTVSTSLSTTISPGLFLQHYATPARTGTVMPTIRVGLGLSYVESSSMTTGSPRYASIQLGSTLDASGGATWLPEPWLAVRIIGGLTGMVTFQIEGMPQQINVSFGAFAEAGVVIRI
jgi:hypothetical protein